jgi:hypothetical protein
MQFLPVSAVILPRRSRVSTPLLNKLGIMEIGRKNAQMGRFGHLTQANWQGAPSRCPVDSFVGSRHRVHSPVHRLLTGRLPTQCISLPDGGFNPKRSFGGATKLRTEGCV